MTEPLVGIIMGSSSDWETMRHAADTLEQLGVPCETKIVSAHRTPKRLYEYAHSAKDRGLKVVIAGAGGAAHCRNDGSMTSLPSWGCLSRPKPSKASIACCRSSRCPPGCRWEPSPLAKREQSMPRCLPPPCSRLTMTGLAPALRLGAKHRRDRSPKLRNDRTRSDHRNRRGWPARPHAEHCRRSARIQMPYIRSAWAYLCRGRCGRCDLCRVR